jgi:hypothetical protein
MRTVTLSTEEADVITRLLRGWSIPVADPDAARLVAASQSILRKLAAPADEPQANKEPPHG